MSLLDRKKINNIKGGLILCLALLFLLACEDDDSQLGLGLGPDDVDIRIFEKELVLSSSLVLVDSIRTAGRSRILSGSYQNENLGTVTATSFSSFIRPASDIPSDAVYDSTVLALNIDYWYGLTSVPATSGMSVHLLQEPLIEVGRTDTLEDGTVDSIYVNKIFYSEDKVPYDSTPIGQATFSVDPEKETNAVHVMLNDDFGTDLFTKIKDGDPEVENNEVLQLYFYGLALVSSDGTHHMVGFNQEDSEIRIYHHTANSDSLSYTLGGASANWFSNIESDRTGTPLAGLIEPLQDFDPGNGKVYLQSGTGIVPKVDFSPFIDFLNSKAENVAINRAEFSIEIDFPGEYLPLPSAMQPYLVKDDNKLIPVVDRFGEVSPKSITDGISGNDLILRPDTVENTSTIAYRGIMSNYAQRVFEGNTEKDFLLYPSQLGSSINHLITDSSRVKLKFYYTTVK